MEGRERLFDERSFEAIGKKMRMGKHRVRQLFERGMDKIERGMDKIRQNVQEDPSLLRVLAELIDCDPGRLAKQLKYKRIRTKKIW